MTIEPTQTNNTPDWADQAAARIVSSFREGSAITLAHVIRRVHAEYSVDHPKHEACNKCGRNLPVTQLTVTLLGSTCGQCLWDRLWGLMQPDGPVEELLKIAERVAVHRELYYPRNPEEDVAEEDELICSDDSDNRRKLTLAHLVRLAEAVEQLKVSQ